MAKIFLIPLYITVVISSYIPNLYSLNVYQKEINGLHYSDILKLFGHPIAKIKQEVKKIDIWRYENQTVYFQEGVVFKTIANNQLNKKNIEEASQKKKDKPEPSSPSLSQILDSSSIKGEENNEDIKVEVRKNKINNSVKTDLKIPHHDKKTLYEYTEKEMDDLRNYFSSIQKRSPLVFPRK